MTTSPEITIDKQNVHLARSRLYSLVSSLFLDGVTNANCDRLRLLDGFENEPGSALDPEELAAIHFDLFQIQIAPYESIFLDDSGMIGGSIAESVMETGQRLGCIVEPNEFSFDHFGNELKMLSNLCLAAQLASSRTSPTELDRAEKSQHELLHTHLLRWIHPFVLAVRDQPVPIFPEMADLLLECVHEHAESLARTVTASETGSPPVNGQRPVFSSAREIAGWLATPCRCGFYLDKRTIVALGRRSGLPSGFGSRQDMIENLFEASAHYSAAPPLVDDVKLLVAEFESYFRELALEWPASRMHLEQWIGQTSKTAGCLDELLSHSSPG